MSAAISRHLEESRTRVLFFSLVLPTSDRKGLAVGCGGCCGTTCSGSASRRGPAGRCCWAPTRRSRSAAATRWTRWPCADRPPLCLVPIASTPVMCFIFPLRFPRNFRSTPLCTFFCSRGERAPPNFHFGGAHLSQRTLSPDVAAVDVCLHSCLTTAGAWLPWGPRLAREGVPRCSLGLQPRDTHPLSAAGPTHGWFPLFFIWPTWLSARPRQLDINRYAEENTAARLAAHVRRRLQRSGFLFLPKGGLG